MAPVATTLRRGYSISRIIKGGWQLAGGHGTFDRTEAIRDMTRFVDAGINTFDCADIYTGVEEMIGEFILALRRDRGEAALDGIHVHTKLVPDFDVLATCSEADIKMIIDRSLKRLNVERLDLVQFFWWDLNEGDPVTTLATLAELQRKGKIRHLGATNWDSDAIKPFIDAGLDLVSMQVQYSLLDARPQGRFADWCRQNNIQLLCYGTLAGGFLTENWLGKPDPGYQFENRSLVKYRLIIDEFGGWDLYQTLLATLGQVAKKHGVSISAVASRAILDRPQVAAVIIGAKTARHLDSTLSIFELEFDQEDIQAIDSILAMRSGPKGPVYGLESDKDGRHGRIMKYNLNAVDA